MALEYQGVVSSEWTNLLRASYQSDQLESGADFVSTYDTSRRQITAQTTWTPAPQHQLVAAIDLLTESIHSSDYSAPDRDNTGLVLGYTGRFGAQKLQADLRWDHNSVYDNQTTGKLGWGMDVAPGWSVRAVAGTAFRAPTFNDLYFPDYGVVTLLPERSRSVEAGLNYQAEQTSVAATAYYNKVSDLIGYQADPSQCPPGLNFGCAGNTGRALLQGITLQGLQQLGNFQFTLALDWLNAKDRDTDQTLPRRAANQQTFAVDWNEGPWQLGGTVLRVSSRPDAGVLLPAYAAAEPECALALRARLADRGPAAERLRQGLPAGARLPGRGPAVLDRPALRRPGALSAALPIAANGAPAACGLALAAWLLAPALAARRAAAAHRQPAARADRKRLRAAAPAPGWSAPTATPTGRPRCWRCPSWAGWTTRRSSASSRSSPTWCWPRRRRARSQRLEALGLRVVVLDRAASRTCSARPAACWAHVLGDAARGAALPGGASSSRWPRPRRACRPRCAGAACTSRSSPRPMRPGRRPSSARRWRGWACATSCRPRWGRFRSSTRSSWCARSPTS